MSRRFKEFSERRAQPSDISDHLLELFTWARGWPNPRILELGVRAGNSTSAFLAALELDRKGRLWSIDKDEPQVPDDWPEDEHWEFLQADSLSSEAVTWAPLRVDVLFIDTGHSFEQTMAELALWVPRVVRGGVVLCHDTEYSPQGTWGMDPHESGVGRALDMYCTLKGLEWVNRPGCYGLGVMRIR